MHFFKLAAIAGVFLAVSMAPMAEAGVKDKDFVKLSAAEQTDVARADYYQRLRLMGGSEQLAKQLSYSAYFDEFLATRISWSHLKTRYKKTRKIPGGKLTKAFIGAGGASRVNYSLDIPTYIASNGTVKPLAEMTQADVDFIRKGNNSQSVIKEMIAGTRPFADKVTHSQSPAFTGPTTAAPKIAPMNNPGYLITPVINKSLKDPMTGQAVDPLIQAVAYADAVTRVCDINVPLKLKMSIESGISTYQIYHQNKTAKDLQGNMMGYMVSLQSSGLITGKGGGDKSRAGEICTPAVKSDLLGKLEKVADGKLDEVGFLKPYL